MPEGRRKFQIINGSENTNVKKIITAGFFVLPVKRAPSLNFQLVSLLIFYKAFVITDYYLFSIYQKQFKRITLEKLMLEQEM